MTPEQLFTKALMDMTDDWVTRLKERAQWLEREIKNGGDYTHLDARREECSYLAGEFQRSLDQTQTRFFEAYNVMKSNERDA